jgi:hypothetical protein
VGFLSVLCAQHIKADGLQIWLGQGFEGENPCPFGDLNQELYFMMGVESTMAQLGQAIAVSPTGLIPG